MRHVTRLTVSERDLGTSESEWLRSPHLRLCEPIAIPASTRTVVLAPHPDDEVLGAGGLLQRLVSQGSAMDVVAVTDGERSHPRSKTTSAAKLRRVRSDERADAMQRLAIADAVTTTRLRYNDGEVAKRQGDLVRDLTPLLQDASWCIAPWEHDGHPDHDATGHAARIACAALGIPITYYLVWAWHWAHPTSDVDIPWRRTRRLLLSDDELLRKEKAIVAYQSQIAPLSGYPGDEAILPAAVLRRFTRSFEMFIQ